MEMVSIKGGPPMSGAGRRQTRRSVLLIEVGDGKYDNTKYVG